jgi:signal transduction histidine kinase/HPt (histidine-containing phosphotransfer) domain-containing protein/ActR/RegA family two-component response regulator
MDIEALPQPMTSEGERDSSKSPATSLGRYFRPGAWNTLPKLAAAITIMLGLTVLIGWAFSIPLLKSMFPGAVEMKANAAIGLILSACALFILSIQPSIAQQRLAQIMAVTVMTLGIVTLAEYLFEWQLGIDELLFRDPTFAYNTLPGRMSPFSAIVFTVIGLALALFPLRAFRVLAPMVAAVVSAIGAIVCLGYLWNVSELVSGSWLPPVAINSALAFVLLGIGIFRTNVVTGTRHIPRTAVEIRVLAGFTGAFLLLIMIGGYTYRADADFENSAKWVKHTQEVRTALDRLSREVSGIELAQRNFLITGKRSYKAELQQLVATITGEQQNLTKLLADNPQQESNLAAALPLIQRRIDTLQKHLSIFEQRGYAAARNAVAAENGIQAMQGIHSQIERMDIIESGLLSRREVELAHNRKLTLVALLATLMLAGIIFSVLFLGIRREVLARAQVELDLVAAKEKAELANRAKDSFLATMSHEIRTPLTGMLGMLELLSLTGLDKEQRSTLNIAWESSRGLLRIVNDILDWSKIEEGKLELSPQPTSLAQLMQEVVNTYSRAASTKSLVLEQYCDTRISAAHVVDPLRLSQVLNNFVSNAIKFTEQGKIELRAELLEQVGSTERIRFSVSDTGIGIAKDVRQRLFQRYRQASADTARLYGGTGLGLSICRRLAELMDGQVGLESEPGRGTTFSITLTLPVSGAPGEALQTQNLEVEQRTVEPLITGNAEAPLVLAVDDHPTNRNLLARQIRLLGLQAETAENGQAALAKWQDKHYALIITDCHMPEMDGYALAQEIRRIEKEKKLPHTPIVAWTANALAEESKRCTIAGMDSLLVKPASLAQLRKTLAWNLSIPDTGGVPAKPRQPAATGVQHSAPIDYAELAKVVPDSSEQVQVLQDFLWHIRSDYIRLLEVLELDDNVNLVRTAHRMKGSSRMVGATELANACATIEHAARDKNAEVIKSARVALADNIALLEAFLAVPGKLGRPG